jgi:N-acylglucosamine-6-phosphate 2-epimerase
MELFKGGLVVSCQALEDEPLHSPYIMSKMALAAVQGGAIGIRANSILDINAIKKEVNVPIIGIIKKNYSGSSVHITPTIKEVDALVNEGVELIAVDSTFSKRPNGQTLDEFYQEIRRKYPKQKFMADCSTKQEAFYAAQLGFNYIGTTLVGYTKQSLNLNIDDNDFQLVKEIIQGTDVPVIAEGNIDSPEKFKRLLDLGAYCVVVGSIITRPQFITKRFTDKLKENQ